MVDRMFLFCRAFATSDEQKLSFAKEFAEYLRKSLWNFGYCNNDAVIVLSIFDRKVCISFIQVICKNTNVTDITFSNHSLFMAVWDYKRSINIWSNPRL